MEFCAVFEQLAALGQPAAQANWLGSISPPPDVYRGFSDPDDVVTALKVRHSLQALIDCGVLESRKGGRAARLHEGLCGPEKTWVLLRNDRKMPFDVLTNEGCLRVRTSSFPAMICDHAFVEAAQTEEVVFVVASTADFALFRFLGLAAATSYGLDRITAPELKDVRRTIDQIIDDGWDEPQGLEPSPSRPSAGSGGSQPQRASRPPQSAPAAAGPMSAGPVNRTQAQTPVETPRTAAVDESVAGGNSCAAVRPSISNPVAAQLEPVIDSPVGAGEAAADASVSVTCGQSVSEPLASTSAFAASAEPTLPPGNQPTAVMGSDASDTPAARDVDRKANDDDEDQYFEYSPGQLLVIVAWSPARQDRAEPAGCEALIAHFTSLHKYLHAPMADVRIWRPSAEELDQLEFAARFGDRKSVKNLFLQAAAKSAPLVEKPPVLLPAIQPLASRFLELLDAEEPDAERLERARRNYLSAIRQRLVDPLFKDVEQCLDVVARVNHVALGSLILELLDRSTDRQMRRSRSRHEALDRKDKQADDHELQSDIKRLDQIIKGLKGVTTCSSPRLARQRGRWAQPTPHSSS